MTNHDAVPVNPYTRVRVYGGYMAAPWFDMMVRQYLKWACLPRRDTEGGLRWRSV